MDSAKAKARPKTPPSKQSSKSKLRFGFKILRTCKFIKVNCYSFHLYPFSQEQLLLVLQKKKKCNARAQEIVEKFLDPVPANKVDYFLSSVKYY